MRIVLYTCCIVLLASCRNEVGIPEPGNGGPKQNSKYAGILAKCKAITIDTLPVYSFQANEDGTDTRENYQYKGMDVDTSEARLFPPEVVQAFMNGGGEISACYFFAINDAYTGIIARTPAMYESGSVKLFMLDNKKDSIVDFIELAEIWGDAGDFMEKQSWLYRDKTMKLHAYIWVLEGYDHSVENEKDTITDLTDYYYIVNVSQPKYDTINRNAGALLKTFSAVNRK